MQRPEKRTEKQPGLQKLIIIVGPTASGKSALAVRLAHKFGGEVISADSRQIYRGLDLGSGKVTGAWRHAPVIPAKPVLDSDRGTGIQTIKKSGFPIKSGMTIRRNKKVFIYQNIPHHCIDFVSPRRVFTAADFVHHARRAIDAIARRGHIPIIAGGTAFWIDALVYNFSLPAVKPDARLRRALEKKSPARLLAMLAKLDPARAATIEQKNPRRLVRAIEIARAIGATPPLRRRAAYNALWIGIHPSYETRSHRILERKIRQRVRAMITDGLLSETKKLLRQGISKKRIREFGFEYGAALDTIAKKIPRAALAPRVIRDTNRYARRQMRWWRRNPEIRWINKTKKTKVAVRLVKRFITTI